MLSYTVRNWIALFLKIQFATISNKSSIEIVGLNRKLTCSSHYLLFRAAVAKKSYFSVPVYLDRSPRVKASSFKQSSGLHISWLRDCLHCLLKVFIQYPCMVDGWYSMQANAETRQCLYVVSICLLVLSMELMLIL